MELRHVVVALTIVERSPRTGEQNEGLSDAELAEAIENTLSDDATLVEVGQIRSLPPTIAESTVEGVRYALPQEITSQIRATGEVDSLAQAAEDAQLAAARAVFDGLDSPGPPPVNIEQLRDQLYGPAPKQIGPRLVFGKRDAEDAPFDPTAFMRPAPTTSNEVEIGEPEPDVCLGCGERHPDPLTQADIDAVSDEQLEDINQVRRMNGEAPLTKTKKRA